MKEHVVSIFPVNVTPTEDDARTMGWRFACTCMSGRRRNSVTWLAREQCERVAQGHLKRVGAAVTGLQTKQKADSIASTRGDGSDGGHAREGASA